MYVETKRQLCDNVWIIHKFFCLLLELNRKAPNFYILDNRQSKIFCNFNAIMQAVIVLTGHFSSFGSGYVLCHL